MAEQKQASLRDHVASLHELLETIKESLGLYPRADGQFHPFGDTNIADVRVVFMNHVKQINELLQQSCGYSSDPTALKRYLVHLRDESNRSTSFDRLQKRLASCAALLRRECAEDFNRAGVSGNPQSTVDRLGKTAVELGLECHYDHPLESGEAETNGEDLTTWFTWFGSVCIDVTIDKRGRVKEAKVKLGLDTGMTDDAAGDGPEAEQIDIGLTECLQSEDWSRFKTRLQDLQAYDALCTEHEIHAVMQKTEQFFVERQKSATAATDTPTTTVAATNADGVPLYDLSRLLSIITSEDGLAYLQANVLGLDLIYYASVPRTLSSFGPDERFTAAAFSRVAVEKGGAWVASLSVEHTPIAPSLLTCEGDNAYQLPAGSNLSYVLQLNPAVTLTSMGLQQVADLVCGSNVCSVNNGSGCVSSLDELWFKNPSQDVYDAHLSILGDHHRYVHGPLHASAVVVSRIFFCNPHQVQAALKILRQHLVFQELFLGCFDSDMAADTSSEIEKCRVFEVVSSPPRALQITFPHPASTGLVSMSVQISPGGNIQARVRVANGHSPLCSDENVSRVLNVCRSIPLTMNYLLTSTAAT
eukprot:TRINITY_DN10682_c0_g1_i1.p1 TRINITY_DN10682_c0_g1~~TRINITY_DN10682_c0_g1_i1.p1  ORF type:complete len:632 (+),score=98.36 TRINITY_DN10682_c0_g1_i1:136-1896(+)